MKTMEQCLNEAEHTMREKKPALKVVFAEDEIWLYPPGVEVHQLADENGRVDGRVFPVQVSGRNYRALELAGFVGLFFESERQFRRWADIKLTPPIGSPHRCPSCGR